jgi:hypothetical protein
MAQVPTFEKVLLEIRSSLLGKKVDTKLKNKLISVKGGITDHMGQLRQLLDEIFEFLELDESATADLIQNLYGFVAFNEAVRQKTRTYEADIRQVLWYVAGYLYMPWLGRTVAFWQLDQPLDKGMPGGRFWYLPEAQKVDGQLVLKMPVTQVVEWLLDLLEMSVTTIKTKLGGGLVAGENFGIESRVESESMERTLYLWLKGQTTPDVKTINKYFPDSTELDFKGALEIDEASDLNQRFKQARDFVMRKEVSAEELTLQIPISGVNVIEHILISPVDALDNSIKEHFLDLLKDRYSAPTLKVIRRRLLMARATQDAYRKVVVTLLGKDFDYMCADQEKNKVLQLSAVYQLTHNLTVEACKKGSSEIGEERAFENLLPALYKKDLLSSVDPSQRQQSIKYSQKLLTRVFSRSRPSAGLKSLVHSDLSCLDSMRKDKDCFFKSWDKELKNKESLESQLRRKSPWRVLQAVTDFWAACSMINIPSLPYRARCMAAKRMRELASTPAEEANAICEQLALVLLNDGRKEQTKESKQYIEDLLSEAKDSEGYAVWKAPLLSYEAKHLLSMNDFSAAKVKFKEALQACAEYSYGSVHGEIARDAFALEVGYQDTGYNLNNCQYYYRNMLSSGVIELNSYSIEDIAVKMAEYFWSDLYKPYPGYEKLSRSSHTSTDVIRQGMEFCTKGDFPAFLEWLKDNKKKLGNKAIRDARGGTLLGNWQKALYTYEELCTDNPIIVNNPSMRKVTSSKINNLRIGFSEIMKALPKSVLKVDYKGQSPAMLAASNGDLWSLEQLLDAGANLSHQDYLGRTVLHAAVAGGDTDCVNAILSCDGVEQIFELKTVDESSVLHTAVRLGNGEAVTKIVIKAPRLLFAMDKAGLRPIDLSMFISNDKACYDELGKALRKEKRSQGSMSDYVRISEYMRSVMSKFISDSFH